MMIAGHFGFAAGVKATEQQTPLWALMLGTVWLDIVSGEGLLAKFFLSPGCLFGVAGCLFDRVSATAFSTRE
jgi:hypothetical protein